jgi:Protein of unknown function (DUF1566)
MRKNIVSLAIVLIVLFSYLGFSNAIQLPRTGQTVSYAQGDDGFYRYGIPWPAERFTLTGDGDCLQDNLTGLIWAKDGNLAGTPQTWSQALTFCNTRILCGFNDWRLPNILEMESLGHPEKDLWGDWLNSLGFINVLNTFYWTSTTYPSQADSAYRFSNMLYVMASLKTNEYAVWPVRGSSGSPYPAVLWKTNQTVSYENYDDGYYKMGADWPAQRFSVTGDCVTDNLTGLMWSRNASPEGFDGQRFWPDTLVYMASLNNGAGLCGFHDWRLPNRMEIWSLFDYSQDTPALPADHPFEGVQTQYWTSTTAGSQNTYQAYYVLVNAAATYTGNKTGVTMWFWPVRGGLRVLDNPVFLPLILRN